jgi:hypothetical protein
MLAEILRRAVRLAALIPALAVLSVHAAAQEREVVSKQIGTSRTEASLRLEFETGDPLDVALQDGSVLVNGESIGSYGPELDRAWRALLSDLVTLDDGPLSRALRDWSPPSELTGEAAELGGRLDAALEDALGEQSDALLDAGAGSARERRTLVELLGRPELLSGLADAVEGVELDGDVRLFVGESGEVGAEEQIDATVLVVDGDLTVRGRIEGDVVVVNGTLDVESGGHISGNVRTVDGTVERDGGEIAGDVVEVGAERRNDRDSEQRIRQEVLRELRGEMDGGREESLGSRLFSPVRAVGRGIGNVVSTLLTIFVLSLVGGVVLYFGHNHLDVVADAARRAPARAAAVGLAGAFLAAPVWLLGTLALVISIVGIPFALLWLPVFPIALALAAVVGYYAVARNVGGWLARRDYRYTSWIRTSNPYTLIAGGVFGLFAAFLAASALSIAGPWLGFLRVLFVICGVVLTVGAVMVGLGAVLITRGGRRPEYWTADFFDERRADDLGGASGEGSPV